MLKVQILMIRTRVQFGP
uniref:Uncharacterized protein n=1 Tax=Rhizophora mucronata TaxID=61149 RepID=A0A2P2M058_RHIMU